MSQTALSILVNCRNPSKSTLWTLSSRCLALTPSLIGSLISIRASTEVLFNLLEPSTHYSLSLLNRKRVYRTPRSKKQV